MKQEFLEGGVIRPLAAILSTRQTSRGFRESPAPKHLSSGAPAASARQCTRVTYVLPLGVVELRAFEDRAGRRRFAEWYERLDTVAAAKVTIALTRLAEGNFSNVKGVGAGVFEVRIDFGPGYRIYFGKDGQRIVILLGGGTKKRQQEDIATAQASWLDYKARRTAER